MDALTQMLERYDKQIAAGILARAAFEVETGQEYRNSIVDNEQAIRRALIAQARAKLGLKPDEENPDVIDKIRSCLDSESERLAGSPHATSAFERLIARGDVPSDLYNIRIIANIENFFGKDFAREKDFIERTVRAPNREQHFGVEGDAEAPRLVSLFTREFKTPFPARNFTMLVAGQRGDGQVLDVHMAWRLDASKVYPSGAPDLVELLRRFADVYGADITLNGQRGRFFLTTARDVPAKMTVSVGTKTAKELTVTRFVQQNPQNRQDVCCTCDGGRFGSLSSDAQTLGLQGDFLGPRRGVPSDLAAEGVTEATVSPARFGVLAGPCRRRQTRRPALSRGRGTQAKMLIRVNQPGDGA